MISPPGHPDAASPSPAPSTVDLGILSVHIAPAEGCLSVILVGELDLASAAELTRIVERRLTSAPPGQLVIDLGAVTFVDSSGVRTLLDLERLAAASGRAFWLVRPQPAVRRVLELTHLDTHFRIEG